MNGAKEQSGLANREVISKNRRFRDHVTIPAAVVSLLLMIGYTAFVMKFAVNVPVGDEWFFSISIVNSAIHHNLSLSQLWTPWFDGHLVIPGALIGILGPITHFNIRVFIFLNCLIYSASFVVVLTLVRQTTKQAVRLVYALFLGLTWFSLGGIDNALWGIMSQVYLVLFFIPLMILFLDRANQRGGANLTLLACSVACAVGSSLCCIQGMIAWPVGLLVILWAPNHIQRRWRSLTVWLSSSILMILIFSINYNAGYNGCVADAASCSPTYSLHHPAAALSFFTTLIGNIIPTTTSALWSGADQHLQIHQHLGLAILAISLFVIVVSFRYRFVLSSSYLAPAFISAGLIWDILITVGRVGVGQQVALQSHYNTPQVLIALGLVFGMFSFFELANSNLLGTGTQSSKLGIPRTSLALLCFLFFFVIVSEDVIGYQNSHRNYSWNTYTAGVLVNLDQVPTEKRGCYINAVLGYGLYTPREAESRYRTQLQFLQNHQFSTFYLPTYNFYRQQGLPLIPNC